MWCEMLLTFPLGVTVKLMTGAAETKTKRNTEPRDQKGKNVVCSKDRHKLIISLMADVF